VIKVAVFSRSAKPLFVVLANGCSLLS
jgi:hypothetical protein